MTVSQVAHMATMQATTRLPVGGGGGGEFDPAISSLSPTKWMKLAGASGAALTDHGSIGVNGSQSGVTFEDVVGPDGNSYPTFGASDYVSAPDATALRMGQAMTIMTAVRPTGTTGNGVLWTKAAPNREYLSYMSGANHQWISYSTALNTAHRTYTASLGLTLDAWNLVLITVAANGVAEWYANSATAKTSTPTGPTGSVDTGDPDAARFGAWEASPASYYWEGSAAHLTYFSGVLSASDITDLFDAAAADGWTP